MFDELSYVDGKLYRNGREAGWLHPNGYRMLRYNYKKYYTHRVVWYLHHKRWPKFHIDHIDQDKLNNRIENLRDVCASVNMRNQRRIKGYSKERGKYRVRYSLNGKMVHVGVFNTAEEAKTAYLKATDK